MDKVEILMLAALGLVGALCLAVVISCVHQEITNPCLKTERYECTTMMYVQMGDSFTMMPVDDMCERCVKRTK